MARVFHPTATIGRVPVHAMLVPFPIVCFVGALLTDIAYAETAHMQWSNFSAWLLAFGTLFAAIAAIFGLIDFFLGSRGDRPTIGWFHMLGNLALFVHPTANVFDHEYRLFDVGGIVGITGLLFTLVFAAATNTRALYIAEPLPAPASPR